MPADRRAHALLRRSNAESQLESPLGIGLPCPRTVLVFLAIERIDGPSPGKSHAIGPDGEYRSILHRLPEIVEDAPADSSPLLQPNHRLDSVFSGGRSLAENRLGYVAVCENTRCPAFVPLDRRAETTRRGARFAEAPSHVLRVFGIEFARLDDERLDRLARFGVDDFAGYLDRLRRRSIVLRFDRRLRLNWLGPETGQDEGRRRGAPDRETNDRPARIKHGKPPSEGIEKHSYAAGHPVAAKRTNPEALPGRIDQLCATELVLCC